MDLDPNPLLTDYRKSEEIFWLLFTAAELSTGRLFGLNSQKGPNKKQDSCRFCQKEQKKGRTSEKKVLLVLSSMILGTSKKYYSFPAHIDYDRLFLWSNAFKKWYLLGAGVFPERLNFLPELPGNFCKELATLHNNASLHYFSSASLITSVGSSWMPILIRIGIYNTASLCVLLPHVNNYHIYAFFNKKTNCKTRRDEC